MYSENDTKQHTAKTERNTLDLQGLEQCLPVYPITSHIWHDSKNLKKMFSMVPEMPKWRINSTFASASCRAWVICLWRSSSACPASTKPLFHASGEWSSFTNPVFGEMSQCRHFQTSTFSGDVLHENLPHFHNQTEWLPELPLRREKWSMLFWWFFARAGIGIVIMVSGCHGLCFLHLLGPHWGA